MATRFYFENTITPVISPAFDAGWEATNEADRRFSPRKGIISAVSALANQAAITVPITTTQQIASRQYITQGLPANVTVSGTFSTVLRGQENATTNNVWLAYVLRVLSGDGSIIRGTLASSMTTTGQTEWVGSAATRIFSAIAVTPVAALAGDVLVLELGGHCNGPTAAGSYTHRYGNNAATDFALTSALTTDLNSWWEMSQDLWPELSNNYRSVKVGDGMSTNERLR